MAMNELQARRIAEHGVDGKLLGSVRLHGRKPAIVKTFRFVLSLPVHVLTFYGILWWETMKFGAALFTGKERL